MTERHACEILIVGGGVVGLSLAYELISRGQTCAVVDAKLPGREASWAGAGILPPAGSETQPALDRLTRRSNTLHWEWSRRLAKQTGIDNQLRVCGGIYLAHTSGEVDALQRLLAFWHATDVVAEVLSTAELYTLEPALRSPNKPLLAAYLPDEGQLRNPLHLQSLEQACRTGGVEFFVNEPIERFELCGDKVLAARSAATRFDARQFCLTAGAWSQRLAAQLGTAVSIRPVRGQMLLFSGAEPLLHRVINQGLRYLVPRLDGRLLVGSSEEEVGFQNGNTPETIEDLKAFAFSIAPDVERLKLERVWSGLRPAAGDGLPYIGRANFSNLFVGAGHFRAGLQLSTATAEALADLLTGKERPDLAEFSPLRQPYNLAAETPDNNMSAISPSNACGATADGN